MREEPVFAVISLESLQAVKQVFHSRLELGTYDNYC